MPPSPSFERINYNLRPAKFVERKMMIEALRRLDRHNPLESYRYIGFGSPYFPDFVLVHRELGISTMVSIEVVLTAEERVRFNRPFACIDVKMGDAGEILPGLPWHQRSIVWLDYDKPLDTAKIADIKTVVSLAPPFSCIVVSVGASLGEPEGRLDRLRTALGSMCPHTVTDGDVLGGWKTAEVFRSVIDDQIQVALNERNASVAQPAKIRYNQLFNFHYQDGMRMLTVGGLLSDEGSATRVAACGFDELPFVKDGPEPYRIRTPNLTLREIRLLDQQLPCDSAADLSASFLSAEDLESYFEVYRYFPHFADVGA